MPQRARKIQWAAECQRIKQVQQNVTRRRGRGASASFHCAHALRWTRGRAAAELRRLGGTTSTPEKARVGVEGADVLAYGSTSFVDGSTPEHALQPSSSLRGKPARRRAIPQRA
jgi:hypothetical protein